MSNTFGLLAESVRCCCSPQPVGRERQMLLLSPASSAIRMENEFLTIRPTSASESHTRGTHTTGEAAGVWEQDAMASFATSAISVGIFISALTFTLNKKIWCATCYLFASSSPLPSCHLCELRGVLHSHHFTIAVCFFDDDLPRSMCTLLRIVARAAFRNIPHTRLAPCC